MVLALAAAAAWYFWPEAESTPFRITAPGVEHDGFLAISYVGIGSAPESKRVAVDRLREHLEAVARAGYSLITLERARAFLRDREPLPRRPLLILFEDGRRETVQEAEALLGGRGVPATLAVQIEAMDRKSFNYPLWRHLHALARTGRWSFAARSDALPAEPAPLSRAIRERAVILAERLGHRSDLALVLSAPLRGLTRESAGEGPGRAVRESFALAFAVDDYGFNHCARAAGDLSMLRVDPSWTGEDLVARLDAQGPRREPLREAVRHDWVRVLGDVTSRGARTVLDPRGRRTAEAWLAGTEAWRCLSGSVAIPTGPETQSWILFRSGPGDDFVRLGWTGSRVELQARDGSRRLLRLASVAVPAEGPAVIDFRLLDRRLRFSVRGADAEARSYALPGHLDHGMVGLSTWSLRAPSGPIAFEALTLVPARARAAICSSVDTLRGGPVEPPDVVVPGWYRLQESEGRVNLAGEGDMAFLLAAAHRGSSVWPLVALPKRCSKSTASALRTALAKARDQAAVDGYLLDLRGLAAGAEPPSSFWGELLSDASIPLGVIVAQERVQSIRDHADRLEWIAIPRDDADIEGPLEPGFTGSHRMLVLRAKRGDAWQ